MDLNLAAKFSDIRVEAASHRFRLDHIDRSLNELEKNSDSVCENITDLVSSVKLLNKTSAVLEKAVDSLILTSSIMNASIAAATVKMNIIIGILSTIGVAFIGLCVKLITGG